MGRLLPGNEASSTFVCQFCLLSPAAFTPTSSSALVPPRLGALFLLLLPPHIKEEKHTDTVDPSFRCGANLTERWSYRMVEV